MKQDTVKLYKIGYQ